jgi:hypothetical protein
MRAFILASMVTIAVGCGDSTDDGGSGGSSGSAGSTGGSAGSTGGSAGSTGGSAGSTGGSAGSSSCPPDGGATVTISGTVAEFQASPVDGGGPKPLEGVAVCPQACPSACTTTDAQGAYSLPGVAADQEGVLLFTKSGYANVAVVGKSALADITYNINMPTEVIAQVFSSAAGFTWPLAGNAIILAGTGETVTVDGGTTTQSLAGSTLELTPAAGKGPIYVNDQQFPDPAETQTSQWGWAGFGDLPPAEYTVKASAPGRTCTRSGGWPASTNDSARIPAIADYIVSVVTFVCD